MFNDENNEIRIEAMNTVSQTFEEIAFEDRDILTLRFLSKEALLQVRVALYRLLGQARLSGLKQLIAVLDVCETNLRLFEEDRGHLLKSLQKLGLRNAALVKSSIKEVFKMADLLSNSEPYWQNIEHVGRMFLAASAFGSRAAIEQATEDRTLPFFFPDHFDYCQTSYPRFSKGQKSAETEQLARLVQHSNELMAKFAIREILVRHDLTQSERN